jgi:hypothetical protein
MKYDANRAKWILSAKLYFYNLFMPFGICLNGEIIPYFSTVHAFDSYCLTY